MCFGFTLARAPVITLDPCHRGWRTENPHVYNPLDAAHLHFSDIDFKYFTVPQKHLDNKPRYVCGVKALSGAVAINAGTMALIKTMLLLFNACILIA